MYKLVAIDLDGTLLNSEKRISQGNRDAIRQAIAKGVRIVICSGRIFAGARIFAQETGTREPLIACNGAIIKDLATEELLFSDSLRLEDTLRVIELCRTADIYFHVYVGDTMLTEKLEYSSLFYWKRNNELPEKGRVDIQLVKSTADTLLDMKNNASKIVVVSHDLQQLDRIRRKIEGISSVEVVSSNFDNFEVMNQGVNKGRSLQFLAERFGIERREIMAIGDNENDESMLRFAGLGVAMGNAEPRIRDIAGDVTLSNDKDGVAEAIRRHILDI
jgi:Cof subfamily protein (haloacid dehalogenase superfamily)